MTFTASTLRATRALDSDHPAVVEYAADAVGALTNRRDQAIALYYRVRDDVRYDPYRISLAPDDMTASATLTRGSGFCVSKAVLLAAVGRSVGIPTRLGFADVRNHLATEKLLATIGTDLFIYHGYTQFLLEGVWVKATPAFNIELCEKFGVQPLEFDGRRDSIFHPCDATGRHHMEYVRDRGTFDDLPLELIRQEYLAMYPNWGTAIAGDFGEDGKAERTAGGA